MFSRFYEGPVRFVNGAIFDPFDENGRPKNNWRSLQEKIFTTEGHYDKPILWGGMFTSRVDGFKTVDYAIASLREIIPPSP